MSRAAEEPILSDWSAQKIADFGSSPVRLNHYLHQSALFADDALARLIETADRGDYQVNTMDVTKHDLRTRREGEIRGVSGRDVLEAVKCGHIWVLLLHPQRRDPRYAELLEHVFDELRRTVPNFEPYKLNMAILISSPKVQVYYHCDIPGQMLWQLRGTKRIYTIRITRPSSIKPASSASR